MAVAALIVELIFNGFALVPSEREARVVEASVSWNYTTLLNLAFLVLTVLLIRRFLKTGGAAMVRMVNGPARVDMAPREAGGGDQPYPPAAHDGRGAENALCPDPPGGERRSSKTLAGAGKAGLATIGKHGLQRRT